MVKKSVCDYCVLIIKTYLCKSMNKDEVYIQNVSSTASDTSVHQFSDWCIEVLSLNLPLLGDIKEPTKNTWIDEHGDEEYAPAQYYAQATTMTWKLGCKGLDDNHAKDNIREFLMWLMKDGLKKVYVPHMKYGRGDIRLTKFSQEVEVYNRPILVSGVERLENIYVFNVTFKINDPITEYVITNTDGVLNIEEVV